MIRQMDCVMPKLHLTVPSKERKFAIVVSYAEGLPNQRTLGQHDKYFVLNDLADTPSAC